MTEIEKKALALVNEVTSPFLVRSFNPEHPYAVALCRAIEQHEAFRQEVSDSLEHYLDQWRHSPPSREVFACQFGSLIIAKPDPLVEDEDPIDALVDLLAPVLTHSQGMAARERENRFRNAISALAARGLKIVEDK